MSMQEQAKKAADQGASVARDTLRKGEAKAEQTFQAAQEGLDAAGDSARQLNLKLIEIMRTNAESFFTFAEDMAHAKDPGKLVEIWTKHTQRQMELLGQHSQELASLGQRLATTNVESFSKRIR